MDKFKEILKHLLFTLRIILGNVLRIAIIGCFGIIKRTYTEKLMGRKHSYR